MERTKRRRSMMDFDEPFCLHMDILEGDAWYKIVVDCPGCAPHDVNCTVSNGFLIVNLEKHPIPDSTFTHHGERHHGKMHRNIKIPDGAVLESADTKLENGVLCVTFAKRQSSTAGRKLEVKLA